MALVTCSEHDNYPYDNTIAYDDKDSRGRNKHCPVCELKEEIERYLKDIDDLKNDVDFKKEEIDTLQEKVAELETKLETLTERAAEIGAVPVK